MNLQEIRDESELGMEAAVEALEKELQKLRSGQANPALVENVPVKCYGGVSPLKQVAGISRPEMRLLVIKPYDPSILGEVERALLAADVGITPQSDGKVVRLPFPPLTEETRRKQTTLVKQRAEAAKVSLRNARRDANKQIDQIKKDASAPEDDCFKMREGIQKLLEEKEQHVDQLVEKKNQELMEI